MSKPRTTRKKPDDRITAIAEDLRAAAAAAPLHRAEPGTQAGDDDDNGDDGDDNDDDNDDGDDNDNGDDGGDERELEAESGRSVDVEEARRVGTVDPQSARENARIKRAMDQRSAGKKRVVLDAPDDYTRYNSAAQLAPGTAKVVIERLQPSEGQVGTFSIQSLRSYDDVDRLLRRKWWDGQETVFSWRIMRDTVTKVGTGTITFLESPEAKADWAARMKDPSRSAATPQETSMNQFPHGYAGLNAMGQPVNAMGQPINQFGQPINQFGQPINAMGQPINQFGQPMGLPGQFGMPQFGLGGFAPPNMSGFQPPTPPEPNSGSAAAAPAQPSPPAAPAAPMMPPMNGSGSDDQRWAMLTWMVQQQQAQTAHQVAELTRMMTAQSAATAAAQDQSARLAAQQAAEAAQAQASRDAQRAAEQARTEIQAVSQDPDRVAAVAKVEAALERLTERMQAAVSAAQQPPAPPPPAQPPPSAASSQAQMIATLIQSYGPQAGLQIAQAMGLVTQGMMPGMMMPGMPGAMPMMQMPGMQAPGMPGAAPQPPTATPAAPAPPSPPAPAEPTSPKRDEPAAKPVHPLQGIVEAVQVVNQLRGLVGTLFREPGAAAGAAAPATGEGEKKKVGVDFVETPMLRIPVFGEDQQPMDVFTTIFANLDHVLDAFKTIGEIHRSQQEPGEAEKMGQALGQLQQEVLALRAQAAQPALPPGFTMGPMPMPSPPPPAAPMPPPTPAPAPAPAPAAPQQDQVPDNWSLIDALPD